MPTSPDNPRSELLEVAVLAPVEGTFTYRIPVALAPRATAGSRLLVPFGRRRLTGIALGPQSAATVKSLESREIREVLDVLDDQVPALPPRLLALLRWVSDYYLHPLGLTLRTALPSGMVSASRRTVAITQAGRESHRKAIAPVDGPRDALAYLAARGRVSERIFLKRYSPNVMETLVRSGWAAREEVLDQSPLPRRTRWLLKLAPDHVEAAIARISRRAPRQSAALAHLAAHGPMLSDDIPPDAEWSSDALRALAKRGWVESVVEESIVDPFMGMAVERDTPPTLTDAQQGAVQAIHAAVKKGEFETFLLHGATGSGKTEVYLRVIAEMLARSLGSIVLVPEIALTPQLVHRFRARFGEKVAVQHSGLTERERADQWRRIRRGELPIVIGARSAVFAPLPRVGAVIVDEEHEGTYKQEENLLYSARDVGVMRAKMESAVAVLGSATPSLESFHNSELHRYKRLDIPTRIAGRPFPVVELVDMRKELPTQGGAVPALSHPLREALAATIERGEQAILFLNRRGFATFVICRDCGHAFMCPNCDLSLVLHTAARPPGLRCHTCDYQIPAGQRCPGCGGDQMQVRGLGTQRVEEEVHASVPNARTVRLDRDSAERRGAHEKILRRLREGEADVLIGTQMVAKGHDFPRVTLVGVISAESSIHFPDFRAPERTFQLLTQVAGRAGRGRDPGRVLVQTFDPDHPYLNHVRAHDYAGFYEQEIAHRRESLWPPLCRLVNFRITAPTQEAAERGAALCADVARKALERAAGRGEALEVLGPAPAVVTRVRNRWRWQVLLKGNSLTEMRSVAKAVLESTGRRSFGGGAVLIVDVDPAGVL